VLFFADVIFIGLIVSSGILGIFAQTTAVNQDINYTLVSIILSLVAMIGYLVKTLGKQYLDSVAELKGTMTEMNTAVTNLNGTVKQNNKTLERNNKVILLLCTQKAHPDLSNSITSILNDGIIPPESGN